MDLSMSLRSSKQLWPGYRSIFPGIAGAIMLVASVCPWFYDPSGSHPMAWQLPVDPGWQLRLGVFNYGLLCTCCAFYSLFIARQAWIAAKSATSDVPPILLAAPRLDLARHQRNVALLCLLVPLLYTFQFLFIDMARIAAITSTMNEVQLTQAHFGYALSPQFIVIQPFLFEPLHFMGRWALLLDRSCLGLFLPFASVLILLASRGLHPRSQGCLLQSRSLRVRHPKRLLAIVVLASIILLGRAPAGLLCVGQAEHLLGQGSYQGVLSWLDVARVLNPTLDQLPGYHQLRGQAWYYKSPDILNAESHAYLSSYYRAQYDSLSAYEEALTAWNTSPHTDWMKSEVLLSLAQLAESSRPLRGAINTQVTNDVPALRWFSAITDVDPQNIYAHYMIGRIRCDFHEYQECQANMQQVLQINKSDEIQSSAYTYLAISDFGLGKDVEGREYLYKAQKVDPNYRNNTARQYMSGMH